MKIEKYNPKTPVIERIRTASDNIKQTVADIISDVSRRGDAALRDYADKFDGVSLDSLQVSYDEIDAAVTRIPSELSDAMKLAAENIYEFHRNQMQSGFKIERGDSFLGQLVTPIERVGLYIPGGTASYPSTVLMNAIPAKIAGCSDIVMITPPGKDGRVAPAILAAAKIAGVDRVFLSGGAQAVAALAYGTESIPKVDKIVGPGNAYVAEAKRQVFGLVDIDMIAGPSEILIVADAGSNPAFVAADLLSQAEHDRMAAAVLITDSETLAFDVSAQISRQLSSLPRREIAAASIECNGMIIITPDIRTAIAASNEIAPEHLLLSLDEPEKWLPLVKNAGSVFLGRYCPESLGDYVSGTNHTLPTSGTARFSSPLGVDAFLKRIQYTYYTEKSLAAYTPAIAAFARAEGLEAHARAAEIRFGCEK